MWVLQGPKQAPLLHDCYVSKQVLFQFCFPVPSGYGLGTTKAVILKHSGVFQVQTGQVE